MTMDLFRSCGDPQYLENTIHKSLWGKRLLYILFSGSSDKYLCKIKLITNLSSSAAEL